jgi:hypothetical protein
VGFVVNKNLSHGGCISAVVYKETSLQEAVSMQKKQNELVLHFYKQQQKAQETKPKSYSL